MVSDLMYRRMCMSGMQAEMEEARLRYKREQSAWRRDREKLLKVMHGEIKFLDNYPTTGPLARLLAKGLIKVTEEFFPRSGIARYRVDFVLWPSSEMRTWSDDRKRALDI